MSKRLNPAKLICMALAKNELAGKQPPRSPAQGPTPWGYARALLWGPCAPRWGLPRPPTLYPSQPTLYPAPNTAPGSPTLYPRARPPYTPTSLPYTPPPKRCPNPPTLYLAEISYSKPAIHPLILHITFLILFPHILLIQLPIPSGPLGSPEKVANRFPSNKGSPKQPSPLIYHRQPPIPRPRLPYSREASPPPPSTHT